MLNQNSNREGRVIKLKEPYYESKFSLETALLKRRSVRDFKKYDMKLHELGQFLWAAQGISEQGKKYRTAPSAGALYPLEVYALNGDVTDLDKGLYKYRPEGHEIVQYSNQDVRNELSQAALYQAWMKNASVVLIIAADFARTTKWYGERGKNYVLIEVGHVAQNIHLQAVSFNLGTVVVGAFEDDRVIGSLDLPENQEAICIMPVGAYR
jgi:SagB-type dehydrogenase family enzyme